MGVIIHSHFCLFLLVLLRVLKSGDKKYERYLCEGFENLKLDEFFTQKTH